MIHVQRRNYEDGNGLEHGFEYLEDNNDLHKGHYNGLFIIGATQTQTTQTQTGTGTRTRSGKHTSRTVSQEPGPSTPLADTRDLRVVSARDENPPQPLENIEETFTKVPDEPKKTYESDMPVDSSQYESGEEDARSPLQMVHRNIQRRRDAEKANRHLPGSAFKAEEWRNFEEIVKELAETKRELRDLANKRKEDKDKGKKPEGGGGPSGPS